ncbi:MAG: hypothetical protein U1A77_06750 [Pirellulales bacterium]
MSIREGWRTHGHWASLLALALTAVLFPLASNTTAQTGATPGNAAGDPNANKPVPEPATAGKPTPVFTRDMSFTIPFSVESTATDIAEVQLLVSNDRGATWHIYARQSAAEKGFRFRASRDGEYWFASRTIDRLGQARPAGQPQPQLVVQIDTTLPRLNLTATVGPAGDIQVRWDVADERVNPQSFQLFYLPAISGTPQPVTVPTLVPGPVPGTYQGQVTFWPQGNSRLAQVNAEVKDAAGNRAVAGKRLYVTPTARGRNPAIPPFVPPGATGPGQMVTHSSGVPVGGPPPFVPPSATTMSAGSTSDPTSASAGTGNAPTNNSGTGAAPATVGSTGGVTEGFVSARPTPPPVTTPLGGDLPGGERPRMTNSKKFALEYDIESAGPGGVSDVELWMTRDRGASWTKTATDADKQSPFDVSVDDEGVFGFRVVVVSKSGLASSAPRAGDLADLWIGVDCTPPRTQLSSVSFGEGEDAGKLDIRWEADDMRLGPRPVTLLYAENSAGPWTTFASGLPNTGQYSWLITGQVPKKVLLRIEVRDDAGNLGSYQLIDPISLQGLNPAGRIRGFTPSSPSSSGASRQPLFGTRRR